MESRHCGQDKRIFFCPVHSASTPCSLQAFGIRCIRLISFILRELIRYKPSGFFLSFLVIIYLVSLIYCKAL